MKRIILLLIALVLGVGSIHDALAAREGAVGVGAWIVKIQTVELFWSVVVANLLLALICVVGAARTSRAQLP
jgi:hypothetical protein